MLTGPIPATHKVLARAGLTIDDIAAFEVNEAFASVPLACQAEFGIPDEKLNPRGGAIALGHPLGASGTGWPRRCSATWRTPASATDCRRCARPAGWPTHW